MTTTPQGRQESTAGDRATPRQRPNIPRSAWVVRMLVPNGDIWRAEKRIRSLEALPAIGDAIDLDGGGSGRVEGVCSPAMSGVHADVYVIPEPLAGSD